MNKIPTITLNNGVEIPVIGNGPAGIGYTPKQKKQYRGLSNLAVKAYNKFIARPRLCARYVDAVAHSFSIGFTLLDNSASYRNESYIASAIQESGLKRKDLFITTRVGNIAQMQKTVREEFFTSLKKLGTDYIDLYQFHWPVTGLYLDTWKQMVQLYNEGYCRALGVANCHKHHLDALMDISDIVPAINQIEVHPLFTQKNLISYCKNLGIQVEAYTPIARMDDRLVRLPILKHIADKYHKTVVQVILRWHIQNGVIPIVRSLNKKRQLENISIFDFELSREELEAIDGININSRLRYDPDNCDFSIL